MLEFLTISKLSYDETTEIIKLFNEWIGISLTRKQVKKLFGHNEELASWMREFGINNVIFNFYLLDILYLNLFRERLYLQKDRHKALEDLINRFKLQGLKNSIIRQ